MDVVNLRREAVATETAGMMETETGEMGIETGVTETAASGNVCWIWPVGGRTETAGERAA